MFSDPKPNYVSYDYNVEICYSILLFNNEKLANLILHFCLVCHDQPGMYAPLPNPPSSPSPTQSHTNCHNTSPLTIYCDMQCSLE